MEIYSPQQVSENNGRDGKPTWVIFKNGVYDLTTYLKDHPGGGELISEYAGRDGTKAFDDFGHSGDAKNLMKKFKIGEILQADKKEEKRKKLSIDINGSSQKSRTCISILTFGCLT